MGQVYQATDTKLKRQVALKILPEAFSADPERLARFQREAEVLASLNHPNIAAIYGLEEAEGIRALVLELVEGPTLADRIKRGPIPLDEALPITKQIAEALEAAHEAGVIHRDLKPANIKVRDDGTVKVLDFGLAKALDPNPEGDPSQSPTLTAAATQMGVIMGTAAYMSPEQARGKPVDKRADIWAFGCVLYEMLTGQMAFQGEDVSLTLASVMKSDLNVTTLPPDVPATVRTVLRRCLEKDPTKRIRDIGDVRLAMEGAFETTVSQPSTAVDAQSLRVWQRPVPATVAALALVVTGAFAGWALTRPEPIVARVEKFAIAPLPVAVGGVSISPGRRDIAISPDGAHVVYADASGGGPQLYVRAIDELTATRLMDVFSLGNPFVSPDSAWVGFFDRASLTLNKVSILGGPSVTICDLSAPVRGADWAEDETIIFGTDAPSGLWRVSANGGDPEELTILDSEDGQGNHVWPHALPGGRAVLFTIQHSPSVTTDQIALLNLETGEQRVLVSGGSAPRYSPTGHIVYGISGTLRAVGFDLGQLQVTNPNPVPVLDEVNTKSSGAANFDIARDGSLVYITGGSGALSAANSLVWVDRQGDEEPAAGLDPDAYKDVRVSPDGTRVIMSFTDDSLWTYDVERGIRSPLTSEGEIDQNPVWTPDSTHVVFGRGPSVMRKRADGTGDAEELLTVPGATALVPESWGQDGSQLLFTQLGGPTNNERGVVTDVRMLSLEGEPTVDQLIQSGATSGHPSVSPNGQWVAYHSDVSGPMEIYVERFPELGDRQLISTS